MWSIPSLSAVKGKVRILCCHWEDGMTSYVCRMVLHWPVCLCPAACEESMHEFTHLPFTHYTVSLWNVVNIIFFFNMLLYGKRASAWFVRCLPHWLTGPVSSRGTVICEPQRTGLVAIKAPVRGSQGTCTYEGPRQWPVSSTNKPAEAGHAPPAYTDCGKSKSVYSSLMIFQDLKCTVIKIVTFIVFFLLSYV